MVVIIFARSKITQVWLQHLKEVPEVKELRKFDSPP
jgi:hypothetical protein